MFDCVVGFDRCCCRYSLNSSIGPHVDKILLILLMVEQYFRWLGNDVLTIVFTLSVLFRYGVGNKGIGYLNIGLRYHTGIILK